MCSTILNIIYENVCKYINLFINQKYLSNEKAIFLSIFAVIPLIFIANTILYGQVDPGDDYYEIYNYRKALFEQYALQKGKQVEEINGYKDFCNWAYKYRTRHSDNGSISNYFESIKDYLDNNPETESDLELEWSYIGPEGLWPKLNNPSSLQTVSGQGLVISVWANENNIDHIMAGTLWSGGLWETTDGGNVWNNISDDELYIQAISSIWVNPEETNEIYVTTMNGGVPASYSYGLYHRDYDELEEVWKWYNNPIEVNGSPTYPTHSGRLTPTKFLRHPTNSNDLYFLNCQILYRSIDGGSTWNEILKIDNTYQYYEYYNPWQANHYFKDMEFDSDNSSVLYVTGPEAYKIDFDQTPPGISNITSELLPDNSIYPCASLILVDAHENFPNKIYFSVETTKQMEVGEDTENIL